MSYTILRGSWFHIIVLKVHAPIEDEDDVKGSFYKELKRVFDKYSKYKKVLGELSAKMSKEDI
jgi:hypothetical protein